MSSKAFLKRMWRDLQWPFIVAATLVSLGLGFVGFSKYFIALGDKRPFSNILYLALQLLSLKSGSVPGPVPWELEVARFLAPVVTAFAGLKGLALVFREQFRLLRLGFLSKQTIICGLGKKGIRLVRHYRQRLDRVVVIEKDAANEFIGQGKDLGAIVLVGDATEADMLRRARCHKARRLISVCGNDGTNVAVASMARRLVPAKRAESLTCSVHIVDAGLCNLLKKTEMETKPADAFRLEFFSIFDLGARLWLKEHPPFGRDVKDAHRQPHLLLVGMGRLGESLLVQAARQWDASSPKPGHRLGVTVVDRRAEFKREDLGLRYASLEKACALAALQMDIESAEFERGDFLFDREGRGDVTSIYVCLDNDSLGLTAALSLRRRLRGSSVPIVVRMSREEGLAGLHSLSLLDRVCLTDLVRGGTNEILARLLHEDYLLEQHKIGQTPETNPALVSWENLPETLKESNRSQADDIGAKLRAIGCGIEVATDWRETPLAFDDAEIDRMARMEHDRWSEERRRSGWKPGPKDVRRRRTPYLVPWADLTEEVRERDRAFVRSLPLFLAKAGFKICRLRNPCPG